MQNHPTEKPQTPPPEKDDGLRRVLTWTFIALVLSLVLAYIGVTLAIHFFDPG